MGFRLAPWHIWPWMILNRPSWRSLELQSNISIRVYWMQQHWLDRRSIERISGYLWIFMELFDDMFVYDEFVMWLLSVALQWLWWPHCYVLFSCPWPWPWPWPCLSLYVTLIYRTPSDGAFRHTAGQVTLLFDELWADDVVLGVWVMPVDSRRTCSRSPGTCLSLSFCLSVCLSVCVCVSVCGRWSCCLHCQLMMNQSSFKSRFTFHSPVFWRSVSGWCVVFPDVQARRVLSNCYC